MARINHHYSTDQAARSAVTQWIRAGVVNGIDADRTSRPFRYTLEEQAGSHV